MKFIIGEVTSANPSELQVTLIIQDFKSAAAAAQLENILAATKASGQKFNFLSLLTLFGMSFFGGSKF